MHFGLVTRRILVLIISSNYPNSAAFRCAALIRRGLLLEGGAYFNVDTRRWGPYLRFGACSRKYGNLFKGTLSGLR